MSSVYLRARVHPGAFDPDIETFLNVVSWTVWAAFALDVGIRLALAEDRRRYALGHW